MEGKDNIFLRCQAGLYVRNYVAMLPKNSQRKVAEKN